MPKLDDPIHLNMLRASRSSGGLRSLWQRLVARLGRGDARPALYGYEWGHPDSCPPLAHVRDHFLRSYVHREHTALEIGPGGGRWTQYMLGFGHLYAVDYHQELLDELRRNFDGSNITFIRNAGADFPGVPDQCIDFLFSFGTFVHLELDVVEQYLGDMRRILKPGASVVLQYADQNKLLAQRNPGFADNDPDRMRSLVRQFGYRIVEEDLTTLWHSSVIRFSPPA